MNKGLNRFIFVIGWLLSPLTFWNDVFINIPISYLLALLAAKVFKADFLWATLLGYWLTNALGVYLMVITGQALVKNKDYAIREIRSFLFTVIVYTAIILILHRFGIFKPI